MKKRLIVVYKELEISRKKHYNLFTQGVLLALCCITLLTLTACKGGKSVAVEQAQQDSAEIEEKSKPMSELSEDDNDVYTADSEVDIENAGEVISQGHDSDLRDILLQTDWDYINDVFDKDGNSANAQDLFGSMIRYGAHAYFFDNGTFSFDIASIYIKGEWNIQDNEIQVLAQEPDDPTMNLPIRSISCANSEKGPNLIVEVLYRGDFGDAIYKISLLSRQIMESSESFANDGIEELEKNQVDEVDLKDLVLYENTGSKWYFVERIPDDPNFKFLGVFTFYNDRLEFYAGYLDSETMYDAKGYYQLSDNGDLSVYLDDSGIVTTGTYTASTDGDTLQLTQTSDKGIFYYHTENHVITLYKGYHP